MARKVRPAARVVAVLCLCFAGCRAYDRGIYYYFVDASGADSSAVEAATDAHDAAADASDAFDATTADDASTMDASNTDDSPRVDALDGLDISDAQSDSPQPDTGSDSLVPPTDSPIDSRDASPDIIVDARADVPAADAGCSANLIANPGFEAGLLPWETFIAPPAQATFSIVDSGGHSGPRVMVTAITQVSVDDWAVQLAQYPIAFTAGRHYHLSFFARSAETFTLRAAFQQGVDPYGEYCSSVAMPSTTWRETTLDCMLPTDARGQVVFFLGYTRGALMIDDVSVIECP